MHSPFAVISSSGTRATAIRIVLAVVLGVFISSGIALAQNEIVTENALTGNPSSEWDISGAGDASIQGFATDVSVDQGGTIDFKIKTDATDYRIDIYRMGYYGGLGARKVATVEPSATLPQVQPTGIFDSGTQLLDCGNWAVSASWTVPVTAVSGVYIAKLVREDPEDGRASHILFIVRDDDGASDLLFQVSETTWQAYNRYGESGLLSGHSTYTGPGGKAEKVSFNRPFTTRLAPTEDWFFNAAYPMIRWLERNGYDVSYFTDTDSDRLGAEILEHNVFLSVGHDEYWSRAQRENVEAARDAGVHLAFFSGNEIYWKIRWENSVDGSNTPYRTMVCYKEGSLGENQCGTKCDPDPNVWTGLWRSGCSFTPPADGCEPENALSGQISWVGSTSSILVPEDYSRMPLWRNTSIASLLPGETATLPSGTLGYEWDFEQATYASSYPPGRIKLSETTLSGRTHHLSLYRAPSGALVFGAGTVQWSWGLDSNHDRGSAAEDIRMQQATVNLLGDMGVDAATLQAGLVPGTPSSDVDTPTSTITFPTAGSNVESGSAVTVTGTASDPSGFVALVEVSTDGGATWFSADGFENWTYTWTPGAPGPATIISRATDGSLNTEIPGPGVNVTIDPRVCPCGIWSASVVPGTEASSDVQAVELGVKFQTDVDGFITALRFYKGPGNTGTHTGNLWLPDGTNLATVVFSGETASGWQEQQLDAPLAVTANTTYIASYHTTVGRYAVDANYFDLSGVDNPPLRALADGEDGPNGVYTYSATSAFPTSTWQSANYWVDIVFNETAVDLVPPTVTVRSPGSGAVGVPTSTDVSATFNEQVVEATISFELRDALNALVSTTFSYNPGTRTATLDPVSDLELTSTYTATVSGAEDLAGNPMAGPDTWSFTTGGPPAPPPDEGPGGPILVIADAANPFGRYFAEVLRNEGFNEFTVTDISLVTETILDNYEVVILGEMSLIGVQIAMLSDWVNADGGKLIAMRPDKQLAGLLGLTDAAATLSDSYLLIDTGTTPGAGLINETIQFHSAADLYTLSGAAALATLYSDATTATPNPAVTLNNVGVNGGQAAAFTYDLARSIVYMRQGNPNWAGQERDGTPPMRPDDLFFGNAAGDPQPDWIDLNKVAIPQADEQQRLLAQLILHMNANNHPLPRFWYFPRGLKAVVIMTGDDHGAGGTVGRFDAYIAASPPGCSVADWECVRSSSYIYNSVPITDAQALFYHNLGFEVALHVSTGCANWTPTQLESQYSSQLAGFATKLPSIPSPSSERNHCITWSDWATQPNVQYGHGIRLDTNYYYWPPSWLQNRPGMFTASGMPMRFAELDGTMIDVYQAVSQMTDESGQSYPFTIDALLDKALGPEGYYGAFCANMHTDNASSSGSVAIVASAQARNVPVVSGRQMLEWLDGRNSSSFDLITWDGSILAFDISVGTGANNLEAMLPTLAAVGDLTGITRDGVPVTTRTETIKGIEYAFFSAQPGHYEASFQPDLTPPVISGVIAAPQNDGTATISWLTDEPADSRVDYGTDPGSLTLSESDAGFVTNHSVLLTGLPSETTIYYRVTSADPALNSTTEPPLANAPLDFTTPPPICFVDQVVADFSAGTPGAGTYLSNTSGGEVILDPTEGAEFDGVALPTGWSSTPWGAGGAATVGGGALTIDGARVGTDALYGPGRSVEFVGTFQVAANQHAGFGITFNETTWAMFSTGSDGATLKARTRTGGTLFDVVLGAQYLGVSHLYRVDWNTNSVDFFIDGAPVHSQTITIADDMRPLASDFIVGASSLTIDWMRMTPYAAAGSFESRVFGSGGTSTWGTATWTSQEPVSTSLALFTRTGDTPVPDGTWTAYSQVPFSGATVGGSSVYIQYRADLASTDPVQTSVLEDVTISCNLGADVTPPIISNIVATPGAGGTTAQITWDTNEPADSRLDYGTDPAALTSSETDAAFVTAHSIDLIGLPPGSTIYYRVTSADASANSAVEPPLANPALSFVTPLAPCFVDATVADFGAGTLDADTYISETADGEVILNATVAAEFSGVALPADWASFPWNAGGTSTVSGGQVTVDGARANSIPGPGFGPGRTLEFVATFSAAPFQHVGFGGGNDVAPGEIFNTAPWAMFSTGSAGTALQARTYIGGPLNDFTIPGSFFGAPHLYRIDWNASTVDFYIDGALVHSETITIAGPMRPAISDLNVGGASVSADWIRMTPYAPSGSFTSRVFDAGSPSTWGEATWSADLPAGTALALFARQGSTPVPDGTWTAFTSIPSSGSVVGGSSQYIQYRADLSTSDPDQTPALEDFTLKCGPVAVQNVIAAAPTDPCIGIGSGCNTVLFNIDRLESTDVRGFTVTFQLSPELTLCTGSPSTDVREGTYLSDVGTTNFQTLDNGGGSYTVDGVILGLPCGATAPTGTLFEVDVTNGVPDGEGTVTITAVDLRDCDNIAIAVDAGPPASIIIDNTAPAAAADLAAAQETSGTPAGGSPQTTAINLSWSAMEAGASVELFGKGYGNYPEYDDGGSPGSIPTQPADPAAAAAEGWTSVGSTSGTTLTDTPTVRDFWYYVAFVTDACGNVSGPSVVTGGALNYHLGDVSDGITPGVGDNEVTGVDVSALGAAYATGDGDPNYQNYLDVGPTTDFSTGARPTTDDQIQFEDLILFSINFGAVAKPLPKTTDEEGRNTIALGVPALLPAIGETFTVSLEVESDGRLQGLSVPLVWNDEVVEPVGFASGELMSRQGGQGLVLSPAAGTVDAAVLGSPIVGAGVLATVSFRVKAEGAAKIELGEIEARDGANHSLEVAEELQVIEAAAPEIPKVTQLLPSAPNPFRGKTTIGFTLSQPGKVNMRIYAVNGRLIRTVVNETREPGAYQLQWDGRDNGGREVATGVYLLRFTAPGYTQTQRIVRLR
jgi:hypothetical protein